MPWLGGAAAAVVLLCGLPYLLAALFGPADLQRVGTFWFPRDFSQYQAAMREGAARAGWLLHDHFSAEPHAPALMYPLYVAAGKLASLRNLSDLAAFTALEWLGRLAVLAATYAFAASFLKESGQRKLAVLLTLGTMGLGWLAVLAKAGLGAHGLANGLPDTIDPYLEVSSFGVLLSAPHLMFGLALTLLCAPLYLRAVERGGAWVGVLGLTVLSVSLVHAFNTPVLVSALVAHAALTGKRAWPAAIVAAVAAAPMVLYSLALFGADPFWSSTYGQQNLMPSPAPWLLPLDFGLVLIAAPLAWRALRSWPTDRRRLLLLWIGAGLVWMYAPVPFQRRFAFGVQPGMSVLAAVGLLELNAWMPAHHFRPWSMRAVNYSVCAAALSTSVLVYVALLASAMHNTPAEVYLWSEPEAVAGNWLSAHSGSRDVVLAAPEFSNPLGGVVDGRVVDGHAVATLHADAKSALVKRFFSAGTSFEERSSILAQTGATIVAFGPRERALGATDLSQPDLHLVYDHEGVAFYRVAS